jgi:transcriptional regulator with XRE-family HTH domain
MSSLFYGNMRKYNWWCIMIGKAIKKMRLSKGLTQKQLGDKVNLSHNAISDYETENSKVTVETLLNIAQVCDYILAFENKDGKWTLKDIEREDV